MRPEYIYEKRQYATKTNRNPKPHASSDKGKKLKRCKQTANETTDRERKHVNGPANPPVRRLRCVWMWCGHIQPNDPSSATAATGRGDCNRYGPPPRGVAKRHVWEQFCCPAHG